MNYSVTRFEKRQAETTASTVGIVDSQSIRTAEGGETRGYDAGKKITGRKRHILVDTLGMLLMVVVHCADVQDFDLGSIVMQCIRSLSRRLKIVFADGAYGNGSLPQLLNEKEGLQLQTVLRPIDAKGFQGLPKRWIVERTFAWINRRRRLSKDYERLAVTSETMIYIPTIDLMFRRLAKM
jgi:putative transposase